MKYGEKNTSPLNIGVKAEANMLNKTNIMTVTTVAKNAYFDRNQIDIALLSWCR